MDGNDRTAQRYGRLIKAFRTHLGPILPTDNFGQESLEVAKKTLWLTRDSLTDRVVFNDSTLRSDRGTGVKFFTTNGGKKSSIVADKAATSGANAYLHYKTSHHDSHNLHWIRSEDPKVLVPNQDIHVRLSGLINEFAVTIYCTGEDYDHVFYDIKRHNR
jgi:hypothetical protein